LNVDLKDKLDTFFIIPKVTITVLFVYAPAEWVQLSRGLMVSVVIQ